MEEKDFELLEDSVPRTVLYSVSGDSEDFELLEDSVPRAELYSVSEDSEDFELLEDAACDGEWPVYEGSAQAYEDPGGHEMSVSAGLVIGWLCLCSYSMSDEDS